MSQQILKKLVERFAPETVKEQLAKIEGAAKYEREVRAERTMLERDLLNSLTRTTREETPQVIFA